MGLLPIQRQKQVIFRAPASRMPSTRVTNAELTLLQECWGLERMLGLGSCLASEALLRPSVAMWLCHSTRLCLFSHLQNGSHNTNTPTSQDLQLLKEQT